LARAAAPDVSARLDAAGLSARLGALAAALPTPAPLPLVFPHLEKSAPIAGFQAPGVGELTDTKIAAVGAATAVAAGGTMVAAGAPVGTKAGPGEVFDAEAFGRSKGGGGAPMPPPAKRRAWWRAGRTWVIAGVALALVLLAAGLAVAFGTNVLTPSHPTPTLANLTVAQARTSLDKVHMHLAEGTPIKSITVGSGDIVSQNPKAGVSVKEGTTVTVVVSDGPPNVTVPSLAGMTCPQASNALTAAHFKSVCGPGAYNNNVQAGVLDIWTIGSTQNPTKAPYGSTITLVPSLGHEPATVPQIPQTYTFAQAQAALQAVGLTATQNNQSSPTVPSGDVISTTPASGAQAPYGSAVTVNVSTGPPTTQVPNVQGDSVQQATAALQNAGLGVSGVSGDPSHNVVGTQPSVGSTVPTGSSIQLFTH
jgi:serine/threonine-protein kinase